MVGLSLKNWHEDLLSQVKLRDLPKWLKDLQEEQVNSFIAQGLPTRKIEDWHYTDVSGLKDHRLKLEPEFLNSPDKITTELSSIKNLPKGVILNNIRTVLKQHPDLIKSYFLQFSEKSEYFACLNTALLSDGIFLYIPDNTQIKEPIIIKSLTNINNSLYNTGHIRNIIIAGQNSHVTIFEQYETHSDVLDSENFYFNTAVTQIQAGKNSVINHYKLQNESKNSYHMGYITVNQEKGSCTHLHNFSLGGFLARENVEINLNAPETHCQLHGLYILETQQHMDQHVLVNHYSGSSNSEQLYKGIVDGDGVGVFNGRIAVHPGAQKSKAKQSNQNILLSKSGVINTKPEFEIYADDVQCSHGATVGSIDENALFYLRARGLSAQESTCLLVNAFSSSILNKILIPNIKEKISEQVNKKISELKK